MLVSWISNTPDTIPANASHIVGVGALVLNKSTREVPLIFIPFLLLLNDCSFYELTKFK